MKYSAALDSPVGTLTLASDGTHITGLWLEGQKYFGVGLDNNAMDCTSLPVIQGAKKWLEGYFQGAKTDYSHIPMLPEGTAYQKAVWDLLRQIPYGETRTYGQLAAELENTSGRKTSPRALGSAVGRNPISILIPCHRVIGVSGSLTGYAGGLSRKEFLLRLERRL